MPYPLNNVATLDNYVEALTTVFPYPTNAFSLQVYNASIFYRLLLVPKGSLQTSAYQSDPYEHFLGPTLSDFDEADLPAGQAFAGIMFRSAVVGVPANLTVIA